MQRPFEALACDYDRTLVCEGCEKPGEVVLEAVRRARSLVKVILVTGRIVTYIPTMVVEAFDGVVAENGAILYLGSGRVVRVFDEGWWEGVRSILLKRLYVGGVEVGEVVLSYPREHAQEVERLLREAGLSFKATLEFNRDRVMVLPKGVSKGSGLLRLLRELNIHPSRLACIGDGENDLSLFEVSGFKAAVANSVPELLRAADYVCSMPDGLGVVEFIEKFLLGSS